MSVWPSTWNNSASTGWVFMKFYLRVFRKSLGKKFKFDYRTTRMTCTLHEHPCAFMIVPRWIVLSLRNTSEKICGENQNIHFYAQWILCTMNFMHNEFFAQWILCTMNFMHNEFCAQWILCTMNFMHNEFFAQWILCTMNFVHNEFYAQWILCTMNFFSEHRAVYTKTWNNIDQPDRPQMMT
jgi:hypothetical protein